MIPKFKIGDLVASTDDWLTSKHGYPEKDWIGKIIEYSPNKDNLLIQWQQNNKIDDMAPKFIRKLTFKEQIEQAIMKGTSNG